MEEKKRIKIRAHHLCIYALVGGDEMNRAYTRGVSGQQMYEHQKRLSEQLTQNPDLEIEITDTYDEICSACPRMPGGPKYVAPGLCFTIDKTKNPRYWAEEQPGIWEKACEDDRQGDRDSAREDIGLPIGTVINARQAQKIVKTFLYGADISNIPDWNLEKSREVIRKELEGFYRKENIKYEFFPRRERSEKDTRESLDWALAKLKREKRSIWLFFRSIYF